MLTGPEGQETPHLINCALVRMRGGGGRVCADALGRGVARGINLVGAKPNLQGKDDPL